MNTEQSSEWGRIVIEDSHTLAAQSRYHEPHSPSLSWRVLRDELRQSTGCADLSIDRVRAWVRAGAIGVRCLDGRSYSAIERGGRLYVRAGEPRGRIGGIGGAR